MGKIPAEAPASSFFIAWRSGSRRRPGTFSEELFRLHGRTALVTGCRRGVGKAMALALENAGADIIRVSRSLESSNGEIE
jgi:hypothetical protein